MIRYKKHFLILAILLLLLIFSVGSIFSFLNKSNNKSEAILIDCGYTQLIFQVQMPVTEKIETYAAVRADSLTIAGLKKFEASTIHESTFSKEGVVSSPPAIEGYMFDGWGIKYETQGSIWTKTYASINDLYFDYFNNTTTAILENGNSIDSKIWDTYLSGYVTYSSLVNEIVRKCTNKQAVVDYQNNTGYPNYGPKFLKLTSEPALSLHNPTQFGATNIAIGSVDISIFTATYKPVEPMEAEKTPINKEKTTKKATKNQKFNRDKVVTKSRISEVTGNAYETGLVKFEIVRKANPIRTYTIIIVLLIAFCSLVKIIRIYQHYVINNSNEIT